MSIVESMRSTATGGSEVATKPLSRFSDIRQGGAPSESLLRFHNSRTLIFFIRASAGQPVSRSALLTIRRLSMRIFSDFRLFERPPKPGVALFRWIAWRWLVLGVLFTVFVAIFAGMHYLGGDVTPSFPPAGIRVERLFCASARLKQWAA